ncbi:M48 family metallopeptidase [Noviherbaspirillum autotrophicum]|uniref:Peptidase M48 n=1 Tax=Noviherbaspirillum autotrophicum TaxID=709839 RepID=A0A0C2BTI6_9BURK|nr:M48 family metallopeptidase [Noviherbaspirillum autotrophicum]KIF81341.1 peptidase M48 [Noviherbaspirillum autotrophicum]
MTTRFFSLFALLILTACAQVSTTSPGVVGVNRPQYMTFSSNKFNQQMSASYSDMMRGAAKKNSLNQNAAMVARVRAIAHRLIPHTAVFRPDAPGWPWEVNVITSDELNAFCAAGGKIAFYSGIIEKLQLSDDEIAAIMGHEISHALREHGRERASQQLGTQLGLTLVGIAAGANQGQMNLAGDMSKYLYLLPNSREHETEADRMGVELAARAGYDPRAAISVWHKMQGTNSKQPPQFMSTHPSHETRIADLESYSAKVMFLYDSARSQKPAG